MARTPRRRKERRPGKGNTRAGSPRRMGVFLSVSLSLCVCICVSLLVWSRVHCYTVCVPGAEVLVRRVSVCENEFDTACLNSTDMSKKRKRSTPRHRGRARRRTKLLSSRRASASCNARRSKRPSETTTVSSRARHFISTPVQQPSPTATLPGGRGNDAGGRSAQHIAGALHSAAERAQKPRKACAFTITRWLRHSATRLALPTRTTRMRSASRDPDDLLTWRPLPAATSLGCSGGQSPPSRSLRCREMPAAPCLHSASRH